jgi:hypothetical protein
MIDMSLPTHDYPTVEYGQLGERRRLSTFLARFLALCFIAILSLTSVSRLSTPDRTVAHIPFHAAEIQATCRALTIKPGAPHNFYDRKVSDRFVEGTRPILIKNATIWTGHLQRPDILQGDIFIDGGILKSVGRIDNASISDNVQIIDAQGAFVTPGSGISSYNSVNPSRFLIFS